MPKTRRLRGLPSASVAPEEIGPNHLPRGLEPEISIQMVGIQSAREGWVLALLSMRKSTATKIAHIVRATYGIIQTLE